VFLAGTALEEACVLVKKFTRVIKKRSNGRVVGAGNCAQHFNSYATSNDLVDRVLI